MTYSHLRADCLYTGINARPQCSVTSMANLYLFYLLCSRSLCHRSLNSNIISQVKLLQTTHQPDTREFQMTYNWSVLFFSRPQSEGWPHYGRTFDQLCTQDFWKSASLRGGNLQGVVSEDLKSDVHYRAADNGACLPSCDCTMKSERLTLLWSPRPAWCHCCIYLWWRLHGVWFMRLSSGIRLGFVTVC